MSRHEHHWTVGMGGRGWWTERLRQGIVSRSGRKAGIPKKIVK